MGQLEVGGCTQKDANSMGMSGLSCRKALASTGRTTSVLYGLKEQAISPCRALGACFTAMPGWHLPRDLIESLLSGVYPIRMAEITNGSSLKPSSQRELKFGYL